MVMYSLTRILLPTLVIEILVQGVSNFVLVDPRQNFRGEQELVTSVMDTFLIYFYGFPNDPCPGGSQGLEINFKTPTGDYLVATTGRIDCGITKDTLSTMIRKVDDKSLILRTSAGMCTMTTYEYQNVDGQESVSKKSTEEYSCKELETPEEISLKKPSKKSRKPKKALSAKTASHKEESAKVQAITKIGSKMAIPAESKSKTGQRDKAGERFTDDDEFTR